MKALRNIIVLLFISAAFANAQITVQGERKVNTDFKKYKSFDWLKEDQRHPQLVAYSYEEIYNPKNSSDKKKVTNVPIIVYSYSFVLPSSDSSINRTILQSVNSELEARGYRKESNNPDLLIAYKIFDRSTQIKGYNADPTKVIGGETYQPMDTVTYALKPGSILISLLDAKTSQVIWEGFASGITKNNDVMNDKMKIKEAINLIFKKYEFRGDKYSMN